jgi:hypothetical protein
MSVVDKILTSERGACNNIIYKFSLVAPLLSSHIWSYVVFALRSWSWFRCANFAAAGTAPRRPDQEAFLGIEIYMQFFASFYDWRLHYHKYRKVAFSRVARGMLQKDHVILGLRFAQVYSCSCYHCGLFGYLVILLQFPLL